MADAGAIIVEPSGRKAQKRRPQNGASIQSVDRALTLLETIAELGGETTLSKVAARAGLNISTCHHLLATLVQRGFVTKGLGRRGYVNDFKNVKLEPRLKCSACGDPSILEKCRLCAEKGL